MNAMTLSLNQVKVDPFDRPQVEAVRFTMYRPLVELPPTRPVPPGYTSDPWMIRSLPAASAVLKIAYTCSPDAQLYSNLGSHKGCTDLLNDLTDLPGFLPEASFLVNHNDSPAGLVICSHTPGGIFGQINIVAVVPRHRRRGLATYLTRRALWALSDKGLFHATLQVNRENRNAIRFFRTLGFQVNGAGVYR